LTNNLAPCAKKLVVRNVINLMVSSSTSDFTKKHSCNYKIVWRKTISDNFSDVIIRSCNWTNKTNRKEWRARVVNSFMHKRNKWWKL
jgi:hypothetical protein